LKQTYLIRKVYIKHYWLPLVASETQALYWNTIKQKFQFYIM